MVKQSATIDIHTSMSVWLTGNIHRSSCVRNGSCVDVTTSASICPCYSPKHIPWHPSMRIQDP